MLNLNTLNLNFLNNEIEDIGTVKLGEFISKLRNLTKLNLEIHFSDRVSAIIADSISNLSPLPIDEFYD